MKMEARRFASQSPIENLNLTLLVDAEHQCGIRRVHTQGSDVARFSISNGSRASRISTRRFTRSN